MKTVLIIFGLCILALVFNQYQMNKKMIDITREQNEVQVNLLNQFGPCWGIPDGQCKE